MGEEAHKVTTLEEVWKELRTKEHLSASGVMGHFADIISALRGDKHKSLCGCGGKCRYYDGAIGYEAMVCKSCGQHYPVL
jgi:hypothetical protein